MDNNNTNINTITYKGLDLSYRENTKEVIIKGNKVNIKQYLPQNDKADLIAFVVKYSLDTDTGCFSPIRTETFISLAILKWYANIEFTDEELAAAGEVYDNLEMNGIISLVCGTIPKVEYDYLLDLIEKTQKDITRYNYSVKGIISAFVGQTDNLGEQMSEIAKKLSNKEVKKNLNFLQTLIEEANIKNMVAQDDINNNFLQNA